MAAMSVWILLYVRKSFYGLRMGLWEDVMVYIAYKIHITIWPLKAYLELLG